MAQLDTSSGTILIVDDNITNLRVAMEHLKGYGFSVLTARTGEAGIERALLAQPELILLDVQLPGIDGFDTCMRLKADPATSAIPVIFMTMLSNVEDKVKGFTAGGVDYVPKPFQIEELLARVNAHLLIYRLQRALTEEIEQRRQTEVALRKANRELERLAVLDQLTRVANRRRFDQYLQEQWERPEPAGVSLLLCDVDFFKRYNDGYGHQAGDDCLRSVARCISNAVGRGDDLVARYGGEEFAVILPETGMPGALRVAELIHQEIRAAQLPHAYSEVSQQITLSMGAAYALPSAASPAALIAAADAALYEAKRSGRNRTMADHSAAALPQPEGRR